MRTPFARLRRTQANRPSSSTPNNFRIQGKSVFLTYPHCPIINLFAINTLWNILEKYNPTYAIAAQEYHQDGEPHLHCLIQCEKHFNIRNQFIFDLTDPNNETSIRCGEYHPNIQVPRKNAAVYDYIRKEHNFAEKGEFKASQTSPKKTRDQIWTKILQESTNQQEFLQRIKTEQPYVYFTQLRNLEYAARATWPEPPPIYIPKYTHFPNVPPQLKAWAHENLFMVSFESISLLYPDITQQDLKWSQEVAEGELEDIIEVNRELNPIPDSIDFKNQNPDQTDPPPSL
ncbi:hypothetical protein ACSBR2_019523 [Camellia fascicularis]